MRERRRVFGALGLLFALGGSALADQTVLHCGDLFDSVRGELVGEHTIVVEGNEIASVTSGAPSSERPGIVDLSDHTCLPGLIDLHTHISSQSSPRGYIERFQLDAADYAIRAVIYAKRNLMAGFTTIRDVGDRFDVSISVREAIEKGLIEGPRIFTSAKSIASTGGHADPTNGWADHLLHQHPGPHEGVADAPEEGRKAVRQRYKDGADLIKITATGGVLSVAKSGRNPQLVEDEIRAIVETANDYGFHVAAHAHGPEGIKRAVRAGVRTIEHGTLLDEEGIDLMVEHGTYLVPTLLAGAFVTDKAEVEGYYPEIVRRKAAEIGPKIQATFAKAYRRGVRIAFGTDTGVSPHGENAKEFALMVEAGMPAAEAISSATLVAARVLDMEHRLGSIEAGKLADVIAVKGNPLEDVTHLEEVGFVMKDGVIVKR